MGGARTALVKEPRQGKRINRFPTRRTTQEKASVAKTKPKGVKHNGGD